MYKLKQNFSAAAAVYDARAKFQRVQCARVADAALMLLPQQARIIDVGCGTGMFRQLTAQKRPAWQWLGVDIAPGMCEVARVHGEVIEGDAVALPLRDASADAVVSSLCLQWVTPLEKALQEIARVLRPGGRAIIATLTSQTLCELRAASEKSSLPLTLLPMLKVDAYNHAISQAGLGVTHFESTLEREYYPDVRALLDSMRGIGAGNATPTPGGSLTGATRWKNMLAKYENLRVAEGIPATWELLFMILRKPA